MASRHRTTMSKPDASCATRVINGLIGSCVRCPSGVDAPGGTFCRDGYCCFFAYAAFGIPSRPRLRHELNRRSASANPVHTSTAPPAVTSPATVCPVIP